MSGEPERFPPCDVPRVELVDEPEGLSPHAGELALDSLASSRGGLSQVSIPTKGVIVVPQILESVDEDVWSHCFREPARHAILQQQGF